MPYTPTYIHTLKQGPFPDYPDPWAEVGRYFKQIHAGMIAHLLGQLQDPLLALGYLASSETSLQITEGREPDLHVRERYPTPSQADAGWDYTATLTALDLETGVALEWETPDLLAIQIKTQSDGHLVTVLEIISPTNKRDASLMADYQRRRLHLLEQGVNVVELDLTRSVKRLFHHGLMQAYPYHILVFLPAQTPRFLGIPYGERLKGWGLPLRGSALPMDIEAAYRNAYQRAAVAAQIEAETHYTLEELPFPTLLPAAWTKALAESVHAWHTALEALRAQA